MGLHIGGGVGPLRYSKRLGGKRSRGRQHSVEETAATLRFGTYYFLPAFLVCFVGFLVGTSGKVLDSAFYALFAAMPGSLILALLFAIVRSVRK